MKKCLYVLALLASGCAVQTPVYVVAPAPRYVEVMPPVVSVYFEPPISQPPPIRIAWAPPPMLVEAPPPAPFGDAVWVGGYWAWQGNWVWAHGHWAQPPQPGFRFVHPYYEHRDGAVIFINGFWAAAGVRFSAPSLNLNIALAMPLAGVSAGPRPIGPEGVFVPPPPGSRFGLIVPAPIGTPPAVMTSAPPIVNVGMRVTTNMNISNNTVNNTVINNTHNTTVINNVTIVAPASAMANARPFNAAVPAQAHLAAAMQPVVHAQAPQPAMARPVPVHMPAMAPAAQPIAQAPPQPARAMPAAVQPAPQTSNVPVTNHRVEPMANQQPRVEPSPPAQRNAKPDAVVGDGHKNAGKAAEKGREAVPTNQVKKEDHPKPKQPDPKKPQQADEKKHEEAKQPVHKKDGEAER